MSGIVSYGTYVPRYRIAIRDIAEAWKKDGKSVESSLGVKEKAVPAMDEDAVTVAFEAAVACLIPFPELVKQIKALFVGSESHPYAVNPTSTIVGQLLGLSHEYHAADLEFACKAGTAGMQAVVGLVESGYIPLGLAIGADTAQGKPRDVLEYTSATAGAAFLLGVHKSIADLVAFTSFTSDTPDFWRRDGMRYPSHAGRFTGEPAYFFHTKSAAKQLMDKAHISPENVDYCVFHMPNGKFPREIARQLGFTPNQLAPPLSVSFIGNPYAASSLVGLAAVLDIARPGQTIFMVSYGSGAGSDGFVWKATDAILYVQNIRKKYALTVQDQIARRKSISYLEYLQQSHAF